MRLQSEKVTEGLYDDYIYHTDGTYQKVTDYIKEEYSPHFLPVFIMSAGGTFLQIRKHTSDYA